MNQTQRKCHEVQNCPNLYIDAFTTHKQQFLSSSSSSSAAAFILTHYHSDHYNGLPRDYTPSFQHNKIHCTAITASLLLHVHNVDKNVVVEHDYNTTWEFCPTTDIKAEITFYDAHHCPGAAIVFIRVHDNTTGNMYCHLHTGDFRYHAKMRDYPLLQQAASGGNGDKVDGSSRRLDVLYLDTTYSHPKYEFVDQSEAIELITTRVQRLLSPASSCCDTNGDCKDNSSSANDDANENNNCRNDKTLILLSCYSIGKEKILWNVANQTSQTIYVNEKKHKMLTCIQQPQSGGNCNKKGTTHHNLISKCTTNKHDSSIHVIPMGMAGEIWPYFRPNHNSCAKYVYKLNQEKQQNAAGAKEEKCYNKVVAFIPTGWANGSNWNKKNAVCKRVVDVTKIKSYFDDDNSDVEEEDSNEDENFSRFVDVEIRLIPYSEHSTFSELCTFVEYLKPRKVIPTVFSDAKDYVAVERRFKDLIDSKRAKQLFVNSMKNSSLKTITKNVKKSNDDDDDQRGEDAIETSKEGKMKIDEKELVPSNSSSVCVSSSKTCKNHLDDHASAKHEVVTIDSGGEESDGNEDNDIQVIHSPPNKKQKINCNDDTNVDDEKVATLVSMGFDDISATAALRMSKGDFDLAVEKLLMPKNSSPSIIDGLSSSVPANNTGIESTSISSAGSNSQQVSNTKASLPENSRSSSDSSTSLITNFFRPKTK